jgi:hypothetical protein
MVAPVVWQKLGKEELVSDRINPKAPNTLQYGQQVADRILATQPARTPDRQLTTAENNLGLTTGSGSAQEATPTGAAPADERPGLGVGAAALGAGLSAEAH